jgi:exopolysaccharide biosynthesis polyprenyl glycosylphosphotransferase
MSDQLASLTPVAGHGELAWLGDSVRLRRRGDEVWSVLRGVADTAALLAAAILTGAGGTYALGAVWHAVAVVGTLAGLVAAGTYLPRLRLQLPAELGRVVGVSAVAMMAVGAGAMLVSNRVGAGDAMVVHWLVASTFLSAGRVSLHGAQRFVRSRSQGSRTLIVGAGLVGHTTAKRLLDDPQLGLDPVGFLDKEPLLSDEELTIRGLPSLPVLGASWDLEDIVEQHHIEHVVVAFSTAPHAVLLDLVRRCWKLGVDVMVVPRLYEVEGQRLQVSHLGALPLVTLRSRDPRSWQFSVKYGFDRAFAALALVFTAPILGLIALGVLITSGRPLLFRQTRVGRDGRPFDILKFRTMSGRPDEAGQWNGPWADAMAKGTPLVPDAYAPAGDRRTRFGSMLRALSLDELPQLWNVVRGDMSIVGPRPEQLRYVPQFEEAIYRYPDRHRVKSGLTGWAQVHGLRGDTSLVDRIEWDNFYIENWSPWLDLKILLMTVPALFTRRGG